MEPGFCRSAGGLAARDAADCSIRYGGASRGNPGFLAARDRRVARLDTARYAQAEVMLPLDALSGRGLMIEEWTWQPDDARGSPSSCRCGALSYRAANRAAGLQMRRFRRPRHLPCGRPGGPAYPAAQCEVAISSVRPPSRRPARRNAPGSTKTGLRRMAAHCVASIRPLAPSASPGIRGEACAGGVGRCRDCRSPLGSCRVRRRGASAFARKAAGGAVPGASTRRLVGPARSLLPEIPGKRRRARGSVGQDPVSTKQRAGYGSAEVAQPRHRQPCI